MDNRGERGEVRWEKASRLQNDNDSISKTPYTEASDHSFGWSERQTAPATTSEHQNVSAQTKTLACVPIHTSSRAGGRAPTLSYPPANISTDATRTTPRSYPYSGTLSTPRVFNAFEGVSIGSARSFSRLHTFSPQNRKQWGAATMNK